MGSACEQIKSLAIKSICAATAVVAAGVALNYIFRPFGNPAALWADNCQPLLQDLKNEYSIPKSTRDCFIQQHEAVGSGSTEECLAALADYYPKDSGLLKLIDAVGGGEEFCSLPVEPLERDLGGDIPETLANTILNKGKVRGVDSRKNVFFGCRTFEEPSAEGTRPNIYASSMDGSTNFWTRVTLADGYHIERRMGYREFHNLRRLIQGETIFDKYFGYEVSRKLV